MRIRGYCFAGFAILVMASGCATVPPARQEPKVTLDSPAIAKGSAQLEQEEVTGGLVKFGQLRTVILSREEVVNEQGQSQTVQELRPELESELAARDFRMFSSLVGPDTGIARASRETKAQLVIEVIARSEFVNSTGKFSKYRANGEARAVRGRDGTLLAVARAEKTGPRHQDDERAGILALRDLGPDLNNELIAKLVDKQSQLLWAGLIINRVNTANQAQSILRQLEASRFIDYVELLSWDKETREATYEIIYGLRHDSDLIDELNRITGMSIKPTAYAPGQMTVFQEILRRYK